MIFFLIILSLANGLFTGIDLAGNKLFLKPKILLLTAGIIIIFYLMNFFLSGQIYDEVTWGIFFIFCGFSYLGIIRKQIKYPLSFFTSALVLTAISLSVGVDSNFLLILLFVYFLMILLTWYGFKVINQRIKSTENVKQLLEINSMLYGIFYFVVGITLATNRVEFLKRLAETIFN